MWNWSLQGSASNDVEITISKYIQCTIWNCILSDFDVFICTMQTENNQTLVQCLNIYWFIWLSSWKNVKKWYNIIIIPWVKLPIIDDIDRARRKYMVQLQRWTLCFCILVVSVRGDQQFHEICEGNLIQMSISPILHREINPHVKALFQWDVNLSFWNKIKIIDQTRMH